MGASDFRNPSEVHFPRTFDGEKIDIIPYFQSLMAIRGQYFFLIHRRSGGESCGWTMRS
jgi:hypothetical protein